MISPHAFVGEGVELGANVKIGPGAVILGPCVIEDDVWIGPGAQIGAPPEMSDHEQNAAWTGELLHAGVRICKGAVIRENAVIHQGSYRETTVGDGSWILNRAYLAHDVLVGEGVTISAGVSVGGHCVIGDRSNIGMNASIHQRRFIGAGSMVGMGTPVARDVPPYTKAYGSPSRVQGVNTIGMERAGVPQSEIEALVGAYATGDVLLEQAELSQWSVLNGHLSEWTNREDRKPMTFELTEG
ncbi:acyl-ACP--UDP-N- acetylglucosamine O-acyltransferase [Leucobacter denitrificans]|uniref:Acyl-ACP--UDP-N- acetylglucosamine O-acyltransferase n=1 Tax=Leucobacter denitrificans TaxID=683042 RepID=A0A7G9S3J4_9MICO|nr:acyl-ACP--UDP-N- acetylglucosamine O-acyltransferase [Leucobacter denitrificans]QNN62419.1 acyl-ACP--UDP-N- acetylglucosamine O-acyltransferase [Leucobacter denitrificans]